MRKFTMFIILFVFTTIVNAQWVVNTLDNSVANKFWNYPEPGNLHGLGTGTGYVVLTDETSQQKYGAGALKIEWHVNYTESWGGFVQVMHLNSTEPTSPEFNQYIDMSMATHISIWYNNLVPSSKPGSVHMRFKLHEAGGGANYWNSPSDHEDWYFETAVPYDATPGWKELLIPLVDNGNATPDDRGFTLPGWSGVANNGVLDLDKIVGYSIECTTPLTGGQMAEGVILWDHITLVGARYTPLSTFDNTAALQGYWSIDRMDWDGAAAPITKLELFDETSDKFEGQSALKVHYKAVASQSWGGYVNFEHKFDQNINLAANTDLYIAIKNVQPNKLTGRLQVRLILYDNSGGTQESWFTLFNINVDEAFDWKTVKIPLIQADVNDWSLQVGAFKNPDGQGSDDRKFNTSAISGFKIEFSIDANGPVGTDVVSEGVILFDFLIPSGHQETDKTPPEAPQSLQIVQGSYTNLITWTDVPGEVGEKYTIYFSSEPITDLNSPSVSSVKASVPEGVGVVEHVLRAPLNDQNVTYYYAIVCTDKAGNISLPTMADKPVTNMAKGVPVVAIKTVNFNADGNLDEWQEIVPFELKQGTAFIAPNTFIDNDNDLSVKSWIAIDQQNLYVAFDVNDDIVNPTSRPESYLNDAPDLFIGMYNMTGLKHTAYQRGDAPDYHIRFHKNHIRIEGGGSDTDSLVVPGPNYYWQEKFPAGYIVEARIPLNDLMNKRANPDAKKDKIYVKEGYRIPIDFSINDNDATGNREGILCYSPDNQDQSWSDVSRWTYTFIGNRMTPITNLDNEYMPLTYSLSQNYPNPFNPTTQIQYSIEKKGNVTLRIYDLLGRQVEELVNTYQQPGIYTVTFNASKLSTGVYFYKLESGSFVSIKKMILIK